MDHRVRDRHRTEDRNTMTIMGRTSTRCDSELNVFNHVLIPLDGSKLAECVLPHAIAVAASADARVTLVHVVEPPTLAGRKEATDPVRWQLALNEAETYLTSVAERIEPHVGPVGFRLFEGDPLNNLIEFARSEEVDLLALSSHGRSGLMGYNLGAAAHKLSLHARVSLLLVRAFESPPTTVGPIRYERLLLPLDGSRRAESVVQIARGIADEHGARLLLTHVAERPVVPGRLPLPAGESECVERFVELRRDHGQRYLDTLREELSGVGRKVETRLELTPDPIAALHEVIEGEASDLVVMSAHGTSGSARWPFGSVALNFIAYGETTLLVIQDLPRHELRASRAELAAQERQGHG